MSYTLTEAAAACGVNKSTVLRAVKSGRISGTKDELGTWHVEAVELHRCFPPAAAATATPAEMAQHAHTDALIRQLEIALSDMRQQRADAVAERDKWREAFENQQRLALASPAPAQSWWRWLRSA
jgi:excisionase family DNA binding protein